MINTGARKRSQIIYCTKLRPLQEQAPRRNRTQTLAQILPTLKPTKPLTAFSPDNCRHLQTSFVFDVDPILFAAFVLHLFPAASSFQISPCAAAFRCRTYDSGIGSGVGLPWVPCSYTFCLGRMASDVDLVYACLEGRKLRAGHHNSIPNLAATQCRRPFQPNPRSPPSLEMETFNRAIRKLVSLGGRQDTPNCAKRLRAMDYLLYSFF